MIFEHALTAIFHHVFCAEITLKCKVYEIKYFEIHIRVVKYQYLPYGEIVAFYGFFRR